MPGPEHVTPRRARPLWTIWWLQKRGLLKTSKTGTATHNDNGDRLYSKLEVFADFDVPRSAGMRWLSAIPKGLREQNDYEEEASPSPPPSPSPSKHQPQDIDYYMRRTAHNPLVENRRGRRVEFTVEDGLHLHHWLLDLHDADKWQGHRLPWSIAAVESGLEVNCTEAAIRDRMRDSFKYHTCKSTVKDGLNNSAKKARIRWVQDRLREGKYDNDKWLKTTFSMDDVHFGFQPSLTTKVHRRPEDKYEWWTVQAEEATKKKKKLKNAKNTIKNKEKDPQGAQELEDENEQTLLHAVCAVGYNFRSKLYWYTIPTNKNGKMASSVLIPILQQLYSEIENHLGHQSFRIQCDSDSSHNSQETQKWLKDNNHLENIIDEGWRKVAQKKLNDDVASLKERLEQVLKAGGDRIAY
ncbi:hypothetical protein Micbo1qcDRAFT_197388 [Microdochium bolleyi]|uniref:Uncharacterized protein n=1 Tax=Microdochium bolleyi TaxID=196109 RepID=A0A136ISS5_9PEZI|nr:hypothetical protein Micbo1qcDRAFT_197388 [Microdochium bolleyi]